jgi:hypothetical protein
MQTLRLVTVAPVDLKRAADLYARGWTLRQLGLDTGETAPHSQSRKQVITYSSRSGGRQEHGQGNHASLHVTGRLHF